jgi:hypothetical protein
MQTFIATGGYVYPLFTYFCIKISEYYLDVRTSYLIYILL